MDRLHCREVYLESSIIHLSENFERTNKLILESIIAICFEIGNQKENLITNVLVYILTVLIIRVLLPFQLVTMLK